MRRRKKEQEEEVDEREKTNINLKTAYNSTTLG